MISLSGGCAYHQSTCGPAFYYPVVILESGNDRSEAYSLVDRVLLAQGYSSESGRYWKPAQSCFVATVWQDGTLRIIPHFEASESYTAQEFVDEVLPKLKSEISVNGLGSRLLATEELVLQD